MEPKRNAFTLVELLVVITIIGILSSLITAGVMGAMRSAKQARIKMLMGQVELALEQYKNKYGEYPPDFSDEKSVLRHIKKRWPRIDWTFGGTLAAPSSDKDQFSNFRNRIENVAGYNMASFGQGVGYSMTYISALPFWLGGLPNNAKATGGTNLTAANEPWTTLIGFSSNPENPFDVGTPGNRPSMEPPILELERGKNLAIFFAVASGNADARPVLTVWSDTGPIVYFKASTGRQEPEAYATPIDDCLNLTNPTPATSTMRRTKNLWHHDVFPNATSGGGSDDKGTRAKNGFGYNFSTDDSNIIRFYPGVAIPYKMAATDQNSSNNTNNRWYNPKSYQLVHPGLDGKFGRWVACDYPYGAAGASGWGVSAIIGGNNAGNGVGQFDLDNIVNFGDGATLKSLLP